MAEKIVGHIPKESSYSPGTILVDIVSVAMGVLEMSRTGLGWIAPDGTYRPPDLPDIVRGYQERGVKVSDDVRQRLKL